MLIVTATSTAPIADMAKAAFRSQPVTALCLGSWLSALTLKSSTSVSLGEDTRRVVR